MIDISTCAVCQGPMNNGFCMGHAQPQTWSIEPYKAAEYPTLKFAKLDGRAVIPSYAKPGDAGLDLTATSKEWDAENELVVMGTGLAMEIPEGYVGLIFPRSSISKVPLSLSNAVGVIDSGYRGEVTLKFRPTGRAKKNYEIGQKIGQLVVIKLPTLDIKEVSPDKLSTTERGTGGFGSTGK